MTDRSLSAQQLIAELRANSHSFIDCVQSLSPSAFLRTVTEWSPRDVVAHLIGWNVYTLAGCRDLQEGKVPFYLSDDEHDYKNVNAASVQEYSSQDREILLSQLRATADELLDYLEQLAPTAWEQNSGVYGPSGQPNIIAAHIAALSADYLGHAQEVRAWAHH